MLTLKYKIRADVEGVFRRIHKASLHIDTAAYQREKTTLVNKIKKEGWEWPRCGALSVSQREDGTLWVFDGGNRLRAAHHFDAITLLPCMIYESNGYQEEAGTFTEVNVTRVRVSGHDLQRGAVAAGSEAAIFVSNLVRQADEYNVKATRCETILRTLAETKDGKATLRAIWPIVLIIFEGTKLSGPVLRGLYWIEEHAKAGMSLHDQKWQRAAVKAGAQELEAATRRGALVKNSAPNWGKGILERLNKNIPERTRLRVLEDA